MSILDEGLIASVLNLLSGIKKNLFRPSEIFCINVIGLWPETNGAFGTEG